MKSYCFIVKFRTPLGTPLKGDTLLGHICWQIAYDKTLFKASVEDLIAEYDRSPFCVVSSGFPVIKNKDSYRFLFRTPSIPLDMLFESQLSDVGQLIKERKRFKKKRWMMLDGYNGNLKKAKYFTDKEVLKEFFGIENEEIIREFSYVHNTLQRATFSTSTEGFAPYSVNNYCFYPDMLIGIVVCVDKEHLKALQKAIERIGKMGFGRDASTGLGKFDVVDTISFDTKTFGAKKPQALYTLAPSVINPDEFKDCYFVPFVRHGRHGDVLAKSSNPFKNPVVMLDEAAVLIPESQKTFQLPYTGKSLKGLSLSFDKTIHQGHTPYIPVTLEGDNG